MMDLTPTHYMGVPFQRYDGWVKIWRAYQLPGWGKIEGEPHKEPPTLILHASINTPYSIYDAAHRPQGKRNA